MRDIPQAFLDSMREYGLFSTLCRTYTFSESYLLYHLTRSSLVDHSGPEYSLTDIDRDSDTVIIFGSGYSINDISDEEWDKIDENADTFSFNHFYKGEFIDIDYHIVRETTKGWGVATRHGQIKEYFQGISENSHFDDTLFYVLHDERATDSVWGVYFFDLLSGRPVCPYANDRDRRLPGEHLGEVAHNIATLFDAVNIAYLMGYESIVLAGVDLYDRRYFWLPADQAREEDKKRGASEEDQHKTANPVLSEMQSWQSFLNDEGVNIYVENSRSLLATEDVLDVFNVAESL